MALSATVYRLRIDLSDVDRGVYQALDLRLARHPSETMQYLLTRVIAYCLCLREGLAFSKGGLSDTDEPALSARDAHGKIELWIDVGSPSPERLHKASKAAGAVVVFTQHDPALLQRAARNKTIHRAGDITIQALDPPFLEALAAATDRNAAWTLVHTEGTLYVTIGAETFTSPVSRYPLLVP